MYGCGVMNPGGQSVVGWRRVPRSVCILLLAVGMTILSAPVSSAQLAPGSTNYFVAAGETGVDYFLVVPSNYVATNPPPLLIYFDPAGSPEYGLPRLQPSCGKAGWILVCPRVLANGTVPRVKRVERELIDDIWRRIRYDRARMYFAGFSGGAWRANELSRQYANEVAGTLLYGTWIGLYDEFTVFPNRLSIARSNGNSDSSAISSEPVDNTYYTQTLVRVRNFRFAGGHQVGPVGTTDVAIAWLNQDFASNGIHYVAGSYEVEASNRMAAAQLAWSAENYTDVATNVVSVINDYPISTSIRTAEQVIVSVFSDTARRAAVAIDPLPTNAWAISWTLFQRSLSVLSDFPPEVPISYLEASIVYAPTNWLALRYLVTEMSDSPTLSWQEFPRLEALAQAAYQARPQSWHSLHALARVCALAGHTRKARNLALASMNAITNDYSGFTLSAASEFYQSLTNSASQYRSLPQAEDMELFIPDRSIHHERGWINSWGLAKAQDGVVHGGCQALALEGDPCVIRWNFQELTNVTVWTDYYIRPSLGNSTMDPPVLPDAGALYYLEETGRLRVYDGGSGGGWTNLNHAPLSTSDWSRITIAENYGAQTWAVSINDTEVQANLGFANNTNVFTAIYLLHQAATPTYVDTLSVSTVVPSPDADRDGLPDPWEETYGNLSANDDPDLDFYLNLEEYRNQTSPFVSNAPPASKYRTVRLDRVSSYGTTMPYWDLDRVNDPCRRGVWRGDVVLAATNKATLTLRLWQTNNFVYYHGIANTNAMALPANMALVQNAQFSLAGPLNTRCRVEFDEQVGSLVITDLGLNDADGDGLADEWELRYAGSTTGADPWSNQDNDAYPLIAEYFNGSSPTAYDPYSPYHVVTMPGTHNGWSTTIDRMSLIGDHLWRGDLYMYNATEQFKFAANANWTLNWGDNNQPSNRPNFRDVGNINGNNILVNSTSGYAIVLFNDKSRAYSVTDYRLDTDSDGLPDAWELLYQAQPNWFRVGDNPDQDKYSNADEYLHGGDPLVSDGWGSEAAALSIAGNHNNWNPSLNAMQLVSNHLWQHEVELLMPTGLQYKVALSGTLSGAWGDPVQGDRTVPFIGMGQAGTPASVSISEPMEGVYRFSFHDLSGIYSVEYAPQYVDLRSGVLLNRTNLALSWTSVTNRRYTVWMSTNLLASPWRLATNIPGTPPISVAITTNLLTNAASVVYFIEVQP